MRYHLIVSSLLAGALLTVPARADDRTAQASNTEAPRTEVVSRAGYRTAGWITLSVGLASAAMGLIGIAFLQASCSNNTGCAGDNWGWSVGGAIGAAVAIPIGVVLINQKDQQRLLTLGPIDRPASTGLALTARF